MDSRVDKIIMRIDGEKILHESLVNALGLRDYDFIMKHAYKTNVEHDSDFQKRFNAFYRVRKDEAWRKEYYSVFESAKNNPDISFEFILNELFNRTGYVEPSFSSKMLATIDSSKPIWDSRVIKCLGVKVSLNQCKEDRLKLVIARYKEIEEWYSEYLLTAEAKENITFFDTTFPEFSKISDTKKIDYFLWQAGE